MNKLDHFGPFWTSHKKSNTFRQVWTFLPWQGIIKTNLFVFGQAEFEQLIKIECHSGSQIYQFQTSLNNFRLVWTILDKFKQVYLDEENQNKSVCIWPSWIWASHRACRSGSHICQFHLGELGHINVHPFSEPFWLDWT